MQKCTKHLAEYSEPLRTMTDRQLQLRNDNGQNVDCHRVSTVKTIPNQCKSLKHSLVCAPCFVTPALFITLMREKQPQMENILVCLHRRKPRGKAAWQKTRVEGECEIWLDCASLTHWMRLATVSLAGAGLCQLLIRSNKHFNRSYKVVPIIANINWMLYKVDS